MKICESKKGKKLSDPLKSGSVISRGTILSFLKNYQKTNGKALCSSIIVNFCTFKTQ